MLVLGQLTGCAKAPPAKAAAPGAAAAPGNPAQGAPAVAPEQAAPAGAEVAANPDEVGAPPAARNPLVQGLSTLLESNPAFEDDAKSSIRDQLMQADELLSDIKQQNRNAMIQAARQQRLRGSSSPHVLFIVASGLGMGDLPVYQSLPVHTPELEALAAEGTLLTQFYAASPDPLDARWSLVTGKRLDQVLARRDLRAALNENDVTIAETLWQAGYTTALFGHWGQQAAAGDCLPARHGFEAFAGTLGTPEAAQLFPETVQQNRSSLKLVGNTEGHHEVTIDQFSVEEALAFLARTAPARPTFLQVFLTLPGSKTHVLPKLEPYAQESWPTAAKERAAAITQLDFQIGRLRERLTELNQWNNTLVIVTSDIPPQQSLQQLLADATGTPTLRGHAGDLYEGGLRVPFLIRWPTRIPAGTQTAIPGAVWDLSHTLFEAVSAQRQPRRAQGRSLIPLLQPQAADVTRFLYFETRREQVGRAVRWGQWKAVSPPGTTGLELYQITEDPGESRNIAQDHPDVVAEILSRMPAAKAPAAN